MNVKTIIFEIQDVLDNSLFADTAIPNCALNTYYYVDKNIIEKIFKNRTTCQLIAEKLKKRLWKKFKINADYIFLYLEPFQYNRTGFFFNKEYLKFVKKSNYSGAEKFINENITILPRYNNVRFTHAMLEILIDKEKYIIDPTCGILYSFGKEDLLRGKGIYESLHNYNQVVLLNNSIQYGQSTLYYSSVKFWLSVYHISYDKSGGLPCIVK